MKKLVLLFAALLSVPALAGQAVISWTPPTTCTDNTPISNCPITGYNLEQATSASGPWTSVITTSPSTITYTVLNLPPNTYFFRVMAAAGSNISPPSNVASKTVVSGTPNPPSAVTAN